MKTREENRLLDSLLEIKSLNLEMKTREENCIE